MSKPEGNLSPTQFEILEVLWEMGPPGGTVTHIWNRIAQRRPVHRNTVLNLVDRLEKRGWLKRKKRPGGLHYWPTAAREEIKQQVTKEFVEGFFGGSASNLVVSLLGSEDINQDDIKRLRQLLLGEASPKESPDEKRRPRK